MDNKLCMHYMCLLLFAVNTSFVTGQSEYQKEKIKASYNHTRIAAFNSELEKEYAQSKKVILRLTKTNGWVLSDTLDNGSYVELQEIGPDGTPLYYTTYSDYVSHVSRADALYSGGILNLELNGEGMQVGVWDGGTSLTTHQEFDNRVFIADESDKIENHATRVMGVLLASGIEKKARGVAFKATALTNDWTRDKIEVSKAAANGLLLSNHSYGINIRRVPNWYFGSYIKVSQDWDKIMYNAPYYLMVMASGNAQKLMVNDTPIYGETTEGYDLLLGFTTAKNGITVAAAETNIDRKGVLKRATVASYSSFGPTDDGRVKPDIAGGGTNVYTTEGSGNTKYTYSTGTSMATPGVTGSMLLLQQYYERLNKTYMKAATLKGLVLHTADDVNKPGPDYRMGWGVINTKKAAETILNKEYRTIITENELANGETYSLTVNAHGNENLLASISWTDPASEYVNRGILNDPTPALVNDLDIRITKDGIMYYPWKLNAKNASLAAAQGDNTVDPYEKINIKNANGTYTITVSHKEDLIMGAQNFSLIVSGVAVTQCNVDLPSKIHIKEVDSSSVIIAWKEAPDTLFEVRYRNNNSDEWIIEYSYDSFIRLYNLTKDNTYTFRLKAICTQNITSDQTPKLSFPFKGTETKLQDYSDYKTQESNLEFKLFVYPNPAVKEIRLVGKIDKHAIYSIINTAGVVIKTGNLKENIISLTDVFQGLYILIIQDLNGVSSTKFYKY